MPENKIARGNASQFFVAGELCRRGYSAVVTLGNNPNTDIFCSNIEGTRFVHIQVKTFVPGNRTCSVGVKSEKDFGDNFFWILGGIPKPGTNTGFEYYIIPSKVMAQNISEEHRHWIESPGRNGRKHKDNPVRAVVIPPHKPPDGGFDISMYRDRWDLIEDKLRKEIIL